MYWSVENIETRSLQEACSLFPQEWRFDITNSELAEMLQNLTTMYNKNPLHNVTSQELKQWQVIRNCHQIQVVSCRYSSTCQCEDTGSFQHSKLTKDISKDRGFGGETEWWWLRSKSTFWPKKGIWKHLPLWKHTSWPKGLSFPKRKEIKLRSAPLIFLQWPLTWICVRDL